MEIEHDTTLDKIFKDVLNIKGFVSTFLELNKTELKILFRPSMLSN